MYERRTNEERSRTTRARLIAAGRELFAERGYAGTAMTQVARAAGLSTGALYHHWPTKPELLAAVVDHVHHELFREIVRSTRGQHDPLARFLTATEVFLARCGSPDVARILLVDGPSVLGARWVELDQRWWHRPTAELLAQSIADGSLRPADPDLLATALLGCLTALGRELATDSDPDRLLAGRATMATLIDGLRTSR